jgi:hypothetical protein
MLLHAQGGSFCQNDPTISQSKASGLPLPSSHPEKERTETRLGSLGKCNLEATYPSHPTHGGTRRNVAIKYLTRMAQIIQIKAR